jgi:hypothetical protein
MKQKKFESTHYEDLLADIKKNHKKDLLEVVRSKAKEKDLDPKEDYLDDRFFSEVVKEIFGFSEDMALRSPALANEFRSTRSLLQHMWEFSSKKKIYRLEEGITAKLLHTKIKKVDTHFIKSPHKSIFLSLPYNNDLMIPNMHTGLHKVKGIYVLVDDLDADHDIKVVAYPEDDPKLPATAALERLSTENTKLVRILAIGEPKPQESFLGEKDDATYFATFFLKPGDVFPQIESHIKKYLISTSGMNEEHYLRELYKFVLNSLLYITSGPADINLIRAKFASAGKAKGKSKKKAIQSKNAGVSKIDQWSVGGSIRLSKGFQEAYQNSKPGKFTMNCPKWLVSGHWRNQAYGPEMSLRKVMWIEPYEKGQSIADQIVAKDTIVS